MRCPDCNKFVSFDTDGEPEVSLDVDADGVVSGSCCIVNACAECSTELTSAEFSVDCDLSDAVSVHRACDCGAEGQRIEMETQQREGTLPFCAETCQSRKSHVLDVEGEATRDERTQTHDRHGKLLTGPSRYRKHYYGASIDITITCTCDETWSAVGTWHDDVQASSMEEA